MPENVPYAREVLNALPTSPTPATDYFIRQADGRIEHWISDLAAPHTLRPVSFNVAVTGGAPPTDVTRTGALTSTQTYGSLAYARQRFRPTVNIPVTGVHIDQITVAANTAIAFHDLATGQWLAAGLAVQNGSGADVTLNAQLPAGHELFIHIGALGSGVTGTEYTGAVSGVTFSSGHAWTGLTLTAPPSVFESATPVTAGTQLAFQLLTGDMTGYDPSGVTIKGISPVTVDYDGTKREYTVSLGGESGAVAAFGWGTPNSETLGTASGGSPHVFNYTFDEPATLTKVEMIGTSNSTERIPAGTVITLVASGETRTATVATQAGTYDRVITLDPPLAMRDGTVSISIPTNAVLFSTATTPGTVSPDGGVTYTGAEANGLFCILHTGVLSGVPDNLFPITATEGLPEALADHAARITALEARPELTAEAVQDIVGAMLPQGTYNDEGGTVSFTFAQARTDEEIQDIVAALIQAGANVSKAYDDAGNVLTISATGSGTGGTPRLSAESGDPQVPARTPARNGSDGGGFSSTLHYLLRPTVDVTLYGLRDSVNHGTPVKATIWNAATQAKVAESAFLPTANQAGTYDLPLTTPYTLLAGVTYAIGEAAGVGGSVHSSSQGNGGVLFAGFDTLSGSRYGDNADAFPVSAYQYYTPTWDLLTLPATLGAKGVLGPLDPADFPLTTAAKAPNNSGFMVVDDAAKTASLYWKFSDGSTKKVDLA